MKKKAFSLAVLLFILLLPVSFALEMGEYTWCDYSIRLVEIQENPMFAPAGIKDDERAVALKLEVPEALAADKVLSHALYESACLKNENGQICKPGAATVKDGVFTYLFAIPKTLDIRTLTLSFEEETSGSLQAQLGKWSEADQRFILPGNITWESTPDDVTALMGKDNVKKATMYEVIPILFSQEVVKWEQGEMFSGYGFKDEKLVFVAQEIQKDNADEGFHEELRALLSTMYGKTNLTDFSQIAALLTTLGIPSETLLQVEASPWQAWMLPDQNTLAMLVNFQGNGVIYFNTARLLK